MDVQTILILCSIGLCAGILSGTLGIGGGVLMVPALAIFLGMTQIQAQGTSIITMLPPIGILAAWTYFKNPEFTIDWKYSAILAVLFVAGAFLGSKLALKLSALPNGNVRLKMIFGIFMLIVATKMIWDSAKFIFEQNNH